MPADAQREAGSPRSAQPDRPADPPHEVALDSRRGFDGKLLHVRVDRVRLPSGRESVREVVEHPGAVAILPLTADGHVLLLRHFRYAAGKTLLELPAGTREPNEDPAATARRELIEETGYAPGRLTELASFFTSAGYSTERLTLFRADDCRPVGQRAAPDEAEEGIEVVPVSIGEVATLLAPTARHRVEDAKTVVGLLWLLRDARGR